MRRHETSAARPEPGSLHEELTEVETGRSAATPAWALLGVSIALDGLVAVAVTFVAIAYFLA